MDSVLHGSGRWMCNVCACHTNTVFTLPCQHHYCEKCLNVWVGVYTDTYRPGHHEFPCRVCWQRHYTPKDGLVSYRQEADVCQLGISLGNLTMDTNNVTMATNGCPDNNTQNHHFSHQPSYLPNHSLPNSSNNLPLTTDNCTSSEAMEECIGLTERSNNDVVLSTHQLDTLNRNCDRKSEENSIPSFPVLHDDYGTMATNRLCYPTCHMYHMV